MGWLRDGGQVVSLYEAATAAPTCQRNRGFVPVQVVNSSSVSPAETGPRSGIREGAYEPGDARPVGPGPRRRPRGRPVVAAGLRRTPPTGGGAAGRGSP